MVSSGNATFSAVERIELVSSFTAQVRRVRFTSEAIVVTSGMAASARFLWEPEPVAPETWVPVPVAGETWTPKPTPAQAWDKLN
jgi:hypothetical protein